MSQSVFHVNALYGYNGHALTTQSAFHVHEHALTRSALRACSAFHVQETFCSDTLHEENKKSRFRYPAQTKSGLKVVFFFRPRKAPKVHKIHEVHVCALLVF